jgi:hypothetical protein
MLSDAQRALSVRVTFLSFPTFETILMFREIHNVEGCTRFIKVIVPDA